MGLVEYEYVRYLTLRAAWMGLGVGGACGSPTSFMMYGVSRGGGGFIYGASAAGSVAPGALCKFENSQVIVTASRRCCVEVIE